MYFILPDPLSFPLHLSYDSDGNQQNLSEDRSFHLYFIQQILINPDRVNYRKKNAVFGDKSTVKFATGLATTLYRLSLFLSWLERKPAKISCERKTIKWATKLAIKGKTKGKRKEREKKIEIKSQNSCLITYNQKKIIYVLSVGNFFQPFHDWPKNGSKRRIWSKMQLFFPQKLADGKGLKLNQLARTKTSVS